ncbi:extracellular solute-binding protein [Occultella kanbiaonis]|uniref:extracellular solute-binding protein n=1 Tax=Occultella kanbiaonis TaxID=2675754 RepID=UPI0013D40C04|nr:extracellular solute-binding protein [Occultella kanbiaonis]
MARRTFIAGSLSAAGLALAACSNDSPGAGASGGGANAPLSIMIPLFGTAPAPDGAVHAAFEELVGRKLDITWVPSGDYPDRMTVTMASGDVPQVLTVLGKDANFVQSAEAGAFWDLTEHLERYPNLAVPDPETALAASVNGTQYGLFRRRPAMRATAVFRQDWLDELGLALPETVDELRTVAEAFVTERPGGSENAGLEMSDWGATYGGDSPYEYLETWFGAPNGWGEQGGKLVPAFDTEEFFEAQRFMRALRADGLMNADFATMPAADLTSRFFSGGAGISLTTDDLEQYANLFEDADPGSGADYVGNAGNLLGPDGRRRAHPTTGYSGILAISKQSVPTEDDLDAVLAVFSALNTEAGQLLRLGVEGVSYEPDGDYFARLEGPEAETAIADGSQFIQLSTNVGDLPNPLLAPRNEGFAQMSARREELRARDLEDAVRNPALPFVSQTQLSQGAVLSQIIGDARIKFIAGEIDEAGYKGEIARWHSTGGDDVISEVNELYSQAQ